MTLLELQLELMMIMEIPDWGWFPWWHFGLSKYALWMFCLISFKIRWVLRFHEPFQRSMTLQEFLLELMMIMDIPDWGWCPWSHFELSLCALKRLCFKFGWNLLSLKAPRTLSKINDITGVVAGVDDDYGYSWLGLVSLMMYCIVYIYSEEAMFKIWLKLVEVKDIKNPFKDWWHCWSCCWSWWWL